MNSTIASHPNGKPYLWLVPNDGPEWLSDEEVNTIIRVCGPYWHTHNQPILRQAIPEWLASIGAPEGDIRIVMARLKELPQ